MMATAPGLEANATQLLWIVVVAAVGNIACALLGCYLVIRRLSLVGDAISHAVLPGLVLAFLFTHEISGWPLVVGAMVFGVLTVLLTDAIHRLTGVSEDTSLGVVFTSLFALGVLLISGLGSRVDLDPGCVLHGQIEFVLLDTVPILGREVPRALGTLVPALLLIVLFIVACWKELKLVSFDPALATAMGFSAVLVHYLLMALVAGVTVASFEVVGSILVVAMLIVPAATAHLLTDRLLWMQLWSALLAALAAVLGAWWATVLNTNVAGMMAVVVGMEFALAVILAPRHGLISKWWRNHRMTMRIAEEDVLSSLYRREETADGRARRPDRMSWLGYRLALDGLKRAGLVARTKGRGFMLTEAGRRRAESLVRAHRLWESYLRNELDLPLDHLHAPAEAMEHFLNEELQQQLLAELHQPKLDPHGKVIPPLDSAVERSERGA